MAPHVITGNVMWVTSQGPCGKHVHQLKMFAMPQYVVTLVIKPRIFSPVAGQPVLTWQAVCTEIVVLGLKYYHPSVKCVRSPSIELWHILPVYIMWSCDLDL